MKRRPFNHLDVLGVHEVKPFVPDHPRVASAAPVAHAAQQPEPCNFCAPLDGDDPTPPVRVPFIVGLVACVVAFLLAMALATGCAPVRAWSPPTATVVLPPNAPACAEWTFAEALDVLRPGFPVDVVRGVADVPGYGIVLVDWRAPEDYPLTMAWALPMREDGAIVRGVITMNRCVGRLAAHELAHVIGGLRNVGERGRLMTTVFPQGGYVMTRRERRALGSE